MERIALWCPELRRLVLRVNWQPRETDVEPVLLRETVSYTGVQDTLPLRPLWIARQFKESSPFCHADTFRPAALRLMLSRRVWPDGFLPARLQYELSLIHNLIQHYDRSV
ncbi:hypothetical protein [Salmonella enterica]|uniref:hypothetical protein n=1 Tax=Salmonella enterica TaxID=28901 RepID=UPI00398C446C